MNKNDSGSRADFFSKKKSGSTSGTAPYEIRKREGNRERGQGQKNGNRKLQEEFSSVISAQATPRGRKKGASEVGGRALINTNHRRGASESLTTGG